MLFFLLFLVAVSSAFPTMGKQTLYDETEARKLLNLAAGAYGTQQDQCLQKTYPLFESRSVVTTMKQNCDRLDNTCESYIVESDVNKELIIVFRGTKTKAQLLLEGWESLTPRIDFFDMGNVNNYFMNAHLVLWPEVERVINQPEFKDYNITFTGHSLGGALATLAAARTVVQKYRRGDQIKILTFGQPRVGDLKFARSFDSIISYSYRVVFRRDIVPHLPGCHKDRSNPELEDDDSRPCDPNAVDKSYHQGTEIWYPDSMEPGANYLECLGTPKNEDFRCSDRIKFHYDQTNSYIWDHRHYFQVRVPEYGKTGCNASLPEGKPGTFQKFMCWLSPSPDCEEHLLAPSQEIEVVPWAVINQPSPPQATKSEKTKSVGTLSMCIVYICIIIISISSII